MYVGQFYACDSAQEILDATWNAEVLSICAVLITEAAIVIISGPFGNTPSPPRIELPKSVKVLRSNAFESRQASSVCIFRTT